MAVYADPGLSRQVGTLARGRSGRRGSQQRRRRLFPLSRHRQRRATPARRTWQRVSNVSEAVRVTASGARFYREARAPPASTSPSSAGSTVYVLSTSGDWARVARNGLGGYMLVSDDSPSASQPDADRSPDQRRPAAALPRANNDRHRGIRYAHRRTTSPIPSCLRRRHAGKGRAGARTHIRTATGLTSPTQGKSGFAPLRYLLPGLPGNGRNRQPPSPRGRPPSTRPASTAQTRA